MVGGKSTVEIIIAAKDRTKGAFAKVNTQMTTMKGGTGRLTGAMNGLKGGLSNATSSLGSFGAALGPVGIAVAGAAVVMATLGGAAMKASLEFEKAFATIRVGTGATGEVLTGLESSFKTVFTSVPTTTANAATAIADLNTRLGLTGEPLEALATQFLNLSRITGTDVAASISSATRVMHDFDVSAEEQSGALDYLFKVSQSTGLGMTQLGNSMTQYGSVMRQMGFDINESAALLGKFEKEGVNLQLVLGSLRMGLANFAKAGEEPVEALQRVITEIQGMGSVADANMKAIEIFGSRAGPDMAAAIREGRFSIEELMATLDASGETINKAAADTLQFGDKWTLLKNNIMEAIAPIGDVITNVLGNAMEGLSGAFDALQKIAGPALKMISIHLKLLAVPFVVMFAQFKTIQAFFQGFASPIIAALTPLRESFEALQQKFKEGSDKLTLFSDIFTIITGAAKWLGEAIGTLVSMAITPLVAKLQEGIQMLTSFYDKLGPIKGALEWVGGSIHNVAEAFREAEPPIEEVTAALEKVREEAPKAAKAVVDAWALNIKSFQEGEGSHKKAIDGITKKISELTEEWMTATDKRKVAIKKEVDLLREEEEGLKNLKKTAEDALSGITNQTQKVIEKTKEFIVTIGDTTIEFKGAAAEVVKNADAYEKLQKSAQTLIDLDWSVFTEFEASLPRIDAGLVDLESSFVGLKDVLEDNIDELENVKQSVMDISEIAAPFLGAGFLKGIKSIGSFAGSLKDAGSAINTFSSLQDVSIDGMINFSLHVQDMVSALQVLECQMEDLVPAFGDMDSLITDIAESFIWSGGKADDFKNDFNVLFSDMKAGFQEMDPTVQTDLLDFMDAQFKSGVGHARAWSKAINSAFRFPLKNAEAFTGSLSDIQTWFHYNTGSAIDYYSAIKLLSLTEEERMEWLTKNMHSSKTVTFQMDAQINALKAQTEQLSKITDALQPYLNFMRTLNELATLSTLSTTALNNGLNSIKDTLVNLSSALSTFNLRPVMESLFGTELIDEKGLTEFTGGATKGFMDTMNAYQTLFNNLIKYVERLSNAINSLVMSFKALEDISDSVLTDQTKLKEVFEGIVDVTTNFSTEMGGTEGFAQKFATGIDAMLKSAAPLISYFRDNNAAVTEFNGALLSFKTTITTVIDVFEALASAIKRSSDLVVISAKEIEDALSLVDDQLIEIGKYLQMDAWSEIVTQLSAVSEEWEKWAIEVDNSMPGFNSAVDTFSTLMSKIVGLSTALKDMRDMTVLSVRDIDEALKNIPVFLDGFVDALALNMGAIKQSLKDLDTEWALHKEAMDATMPAYEDSTSQIGKLVGSLLSLNSALKELAEMGTISGAEFDKGFKSLMTTISNFAASLSINVDGLIFSLQKLRTVWMENEAVLFPLIRDFAIITDNLWGVAHNANRMAEEFSNISENSKTLKKGFESLIKFIDQVVKGTKEFYTTEAADELATFIDDVGKVIDSFVNLERELGTAMGKVEKAISGAVGNVERRIESLKSLNGTLYQYGINLINSYINGIISQEAALEAEMTYIAGIISNPIAINSNAKEGPLSRLTDWPRNLIQSYSSGLKAEMHTLNASFAGLAPGMGAGSAGSAGGGNKNVNFYVTQTISDRATADYANRDLERLMHKHAVM